jgi:hypothetical protein
LCYFELKIDKNKLLGDIKIFKISEPFAFAEIENKINKIIPVSVCIFSLKIK